MRRLSIPFGTLLGARLRVHPLLLAMLVFSYWMGALPYYAMMFALILGHEIAHSLAAKALGIDILEIELAPFGGVARLSAELEMRPAAEIIVSLAGPALNVLLVLLAAFWDRYAFFPPESLSAFIGVNLMLAGFNLVPALPLDGGRVLRAALALPLGFSRATKIASLLGVGLGIAIVAAGIWGAVKGLVNLTYFICGITLVLTALRERRSAAALYLRDVTARAGALARDGALPVKYLAAPGDATVRAMVGRFRPRTYHRVVLLDGALKERGELSEGEIVKALMENRSEDTLMDLASTEKKRRHL